MVEDAFGAVGGKERFQTGTDGWYAPAGDGGALVFRDGLGQSAWTFVKAMLDHMTGRVQVRIGVTTGQVTVIEQNLPVGTGIFEADELASAATVGKPCVSSRFWNQTLLPGDRSGWTAVSIGGERLLVEPIAERSGP